LLSNLKKKKNSLIILDLRLSQPHHEIIYFVALLKKEIAISYDSLKNFTVSLFSVRKISVYSTNKKW
jgi:hypothetical protein